MLKQNDRSYHEARARDEIQRAEEALDPSIARVHRELASMHRRRLNTMADEAELKLQTIAASQGRAVERAS